MKLMIFVKSIKVARGKYLYSVAVYPDNLLYKISYINVEHIQLILSMDDRSYICLQ
jgi:hypothetical protein